MSGALLLALTGVSDPTVTEILTWINSAGVLGLMTCILWLLLTARLVPGSQLAKAEARADRAECLLVETHATLIRDVVPALTRANDTADRTNALADRMLDALARRRPT
jgi:hypothetical protein